MTFLISIIALFVPLTEKVYSSTHRKGLELFVAFSAGCSKFTCDCNVAKYSTMSSNCSLIAVTSFYND